MQAISQKGEEITFTENCTINNGWFSMTPFGNRTIHEQSSANNSPKNLQLGHLQCTYRSPSSYVRTGGDREQKNVPRGEKGRYSNLSTSLLIPS